jgi:hypothetical protein
MIGNRSELQSFIDRCRARGDDEKVGPHEPFCR